MMRYSHKIHSDYKPLCPKHLLKILLENNLSNRFYCIFAKTALTALSEMDMKKENYRFFIETMRRNGTKPTEIYQFLYQAWQDNAPSQATVYRICTGFESGSREAFSDDGRSGRPISVCIAENVNAVNKIIKKDPRVTLRELKDQLGISFGSVHSIVSVNLQLTSMSSRWVPHSLTVEQKQQRVLVAQNWLQIFSGYDAVELPNCLVVIDENYFYHRILGRKMSNRA